MRNVLRDIISESRLDPTRLIDSWKILGNAVQTWLQTGHLSRITIEFFAPGSNRAVNVWEFEIKYDGSGIDGDMWVAREHVRRTVEKAGRPPANASYNVILQHQPGAPDIPGMVPAEYLSREGLVGRSSGTAIATPDIMVGLKYWRAA